MLPSHHDSFIASLLSSLYISGLTDLLDKELTEAKREYNNLCAIEDPEDEPYKSKYKGRKLMVH